MAVQRLPRAARLPVHKLRTNVDALNLGSAKVYHLPNWHELSHPERLAVIRQIAEMRGRDPRIAQLATKILKQYKVRPRHYKEQAAALLKWIQDPNNIYYVNEAGERLQDPIYTINAGFGDCDDQISLLASLFESIGLPWRLCLSGRDDNGNKVRHIEGEQVGQAKWTHIYCAVGVPPFNPNQWFFCEPTVEGVPLGWDVVSGDHSFLPEMLRPIPGPPRLILSGRAPKGFKPKRLPKPENRSPAYAEAYGNISARPNQSSTQIGAAVGASVAATSEQPGGLDWMRIAAAIATGVAISVITPIVAEWIRGTGMWEGGGSIFTRFANRGEGPISQSKLVIPSPIDQS